MGDRQDPPFLASFWAQQAAKALVCSAPPPLGQKTKWFRLQVGKCEESQGLTLKMTLETVGWRKTKRLK